MKTKLLTIAVAAGLAFSASGSVFADDDAYQGSWYVMPTLGVLHADSDLQAESTSANYGVRIGKQISEHWDVQLGLTSANPDAKKNIAGFPSSGDYRQTLFGLDALYMFSRSNFRPFVLAGLGVAHNNINYTVNNVAVSGSNTSFMGNVGAGLQYFVTDNIALQADVREVWSKAEAGANAFNVRSSETVGNTYLNFGLIFAFGAPPKPSMAEAAPEPAPMAEPMEEPAPMMDEIAPEEEPALPPMMDEADQEGPSPAAFEPITLQAEVLFGFDKDNLKEEGKQILNDQVVEKMKAHPEVELVLITGYTDRIGDDKYNQKLSERRAIQVKKYIASQGIAESRLHSVGKGKADPIELCSGVRGKKLIDCLQPNRRVVVEIEVQRQP
jgi:OOP family OmpA-OmpF porin